MIHNMVDRFVYYCYLFILFVEEKLLMVYKTVKELIWG